MISRKLMRRVEDLEERTAPLMTERHRIKVQYVDENMNIVDSYVVEFPPPGVIPLPLGKKRRWR